MIDNIRQISVCADVTCLMAASRILKRQVPIAGNFPISKIAVICCVAV